MAAYTSTQSGNWNDTATWGGGGFPVDGDTATVSTSHVVTVTANAVVGTSPGTNTTVLTNNGRINVNAGFTLTVKGQLTMHGTTGTNGQAHFAAGSELIFDGTASGVKYGFQIGTATSTTALLKFNGTSGSRCKMRSLGSGTVNAFNNTGFFNPAGLIEADFTDFFQLGDSGNRFMYPWVPNTAGRGFYLRNCTVDACGYLQVQTGIGAAGFFDISNTVFTNSQNTNTLEVVGSAPTGGALRQLANSRFDRPVRFVPITGFTVTDTVFAGAIVLTSPFVPVSWQRNVVNVNATSPNSPLVVENSYFTDTAATTNARAVLMQNVTGYDITGCVFDYPASTVGDFIASANTSYSLTADYNLLLWNSAQANPGKLVSPLNSPDVAGLTVDHNTVVSSLASTVETGVGAYGETFAGTAGMYKSLRSNLVYTTSGVGCVLARTNTSTVSNILDGNDKGDYNGFSTPATTTGGNVQAVFGAKGGYVDTLTTPTVAMFTSTANLGTNDVVADPRFVDTTRCLATFDSAYLGNTATAWETGQSYVVGDIRSTQSTGFYGNVVVNFRCISAHTSSTGDATNGQPGVATNWRTRWELASWFRIRTSSAVYNSTIKQATPRDLIEWVKAGWAPTNTAFRNTGHDGTTIGAMAWVSAGAASPSVRVGVSVGI